MNAGTGAASKEQGSESAVLLADRSRATIYGILSCLYDRPVTPDIRDDLTKTGFLKVLMKASPDLAEEDFQLSDLDALNTEFTRLFLGPGPHNPPFASVYREDDQWTGELFGSTTGEVKRFMQYYGLSVEKPGAIPDHISILFEFIEKVIRAKIEAVKANRPRKEREEAFKTAGNIQREFFTNYIGSWVEVFLGRVKETKPLPFYASVVEFTRKFIDQEREDLAG